MSTHVKAGCHCGLNVFNVAFATESLPYPSGLCHCSFCRHSTGVLATNFALINGAPLSPDSTDPADLTTLTAYKTSAIVNRWFCGRCSTHLLCEILLEHQHLWCIAAGALERTEGIVKPTHHSWISDTFDGGIADFITSIDGVDLPRYATGDRTEVLPTGWSNLPVSPVQPEAEDRLHVYCHCKANSFFITRPSATSSQAAASDAEKPARYHVGVCVCDSCRLSSGFEIACWATIPRANMLFLNPTTGELAPLELRDQEKRPSGLKEYRSSEGRHREFCATCGAKVFWWEDPQPDILELSLGVVDEKQNGARAESWFEWGKTVSYSEDACSGSLIRSLEDGLSKFKA
ncbi:hypothetical protein H0H92_007548 [Tricholoma furcatifolium]|nr:hypothetical protein H0H92_007548 [Tricholoma furcatifolium]